MAERTIYKCKRFLFNTLWIVRPKHRIRRNSRQLRRKTKSKNSQRIIQTLSKILIQQRIIHRWRKIKNNPKSKTIPKHNIT